MDEPIGACSPLYASLFDDPSSSSICLKSACIRSDASFSLPYEIVFSMSFMCSLHGGKKVDFDGQLYYKWYKIKIFAERPVGSEVQELFPYWEGRLPHMSSFAALGTNIYTFGGQLHSPSSDRFTFSPNLNVLDVYRWPIVDVLPAAPMIFPRLDPQSLVLDGKLFIIGGNILTESTTCWDICWDCEEEDYEEREFEEEEYEEEESEKEESTKGTKGNLRKMNTRNTTMRNTRKRKMKFPLYSFITPVVTLLLRFMTPSLEDGIPWPGLHFL
jgi:hypothetical protein